MHNSTIIYKIIMLEKGFETFENLLFAFEKKMKPSTLLKKKKKS